MDTHAYTHTAADVRLCLGWEVGQSVKYVSLFIGSTKMQRRMKCSMWSSDATLSHFILTSSFHQPTASILNFSSCRGCVLFYLRQDTSLHAFLLTHLAFCHSLTASESHSENTCIFSPSISPALQTAPNQINKGWPMELCMEQAVDC